MTTPFDQLQQITDANGIDSGLDFLEQHVRRNKNYAHLFEVLKMRVRHGMGLPILYSRMRDDLDEESQRKLEDGLLAACREVGTLLFKQGDFVHGWNYLQPVGDRHLNEKLIRSIKVNQQNADDVIEIAVSQGAAPAYGFEILLRHYGTCNAITTFDQAAAVHDLNCQRSMAGALLNHLYDELVGNLVSSLPELKTNSNDTTTLAAILDSDGLGSDNDCVIDATHLASVVRISRILQDPKLIQKAYELARYGDGLADDLKYPGQVPFEDTYPDHLYYFAAILGQDVDAAVDHFSKKAEQHDVEQYGGVAIETLVDLLAKTGQNDRAVAVLVDRLLGKHQLLGIAPEPHELAKTDQQKQKLLEHYQRESDLLGFGQTLLNSKSN